MIARRVLAAVILLIALDAVPPFVLAAEAEPTAEAIEHFEKAVRPLLAAKCWSCHGSEKQKASLRLDSSAAIRAGGDSGPAALPGDPDHSPMILAIRYQDEPKMPPDGKLSDGE